MQFLLPIFGRSPPLRGGSSASRPMLYEKLHTRSAHFRSARWLLGPEGYTARSRGEHLSTSSPCSLTTSTPFSENSYSLDDFISHWCKEPTAVTPPLRRVPFIIKRRTYCKRHIPGTISSLHSSLHQAYSCLHQACCSFSKHTPSTISSFRSSFCRARRSFSSWLINISHRTASHSDAFLCSQRSFCFARKFSNPARTSSAFKCETYQGNETCAPLHSLCRSNSSNIINRNSHISRNIQSSTSMSCLDTTSNRIHSITTKRRMSVYKWWRLLDRCFSLDVPRKNILSNVAEKICLSSTQLKRTSYTQKKYSFIYNIYPPFHTKARNFFPTENLFVTGSTHISGECNITRQHRCLCIGAGKQHAEPGLQVQQPLLLQQQQEQQEQAPLQRETQKHDEHQQTVRQKEEEEQQQQKQRNKRLHEQHRPPLSQPHEWGRSGRLEDMQPLGSQQRGYCPNLLSEHSTPQQQMQQRQCKQTQKKKQQEQQQQHVLQLHHSQSTEQVQQDHTTQEAHTRGGQQQEPTVGYEEQQQQNQPPQQKHKPQQQQKKQKHHQQQQQKQQQQQSQKKLQQQKQKAALCYGVTERHFSTERHVSGIGTAAGETARPSQMLGSGTLMAQWENAAENVRQQFRAVFPRVLNVVLQHVQDLQQEAGVIFDEQILQYYARLLDYCCTGGKLTRGQLVLYAAAAVRQRPLLLPGPAHEMEHKSHAAGAASVAAFPLSKSVDSKISDTSHRRRRTLSTAYDTATAVDEGPAAPAVASASDLLQATEPFAFDDTAAAPSTNTRFFPFKAVIREEDKEHREFVQLAALGWCVELLQASFLICDDVMDNSLTRRGKPCWFRCPGVGCSNAMNDFLFIESAIYRVLRVFLGRHSCYSEMQELLLSTTFTTVVGQHIDSAPLVKEETLLLQRLEAHLQQLQQKFAKHETQGEHCQPRGEEVARDRFGGCEQQLLQSERQQQLQQDAWGSLQHHHEGGAGGHARQQQIHFRDGGSLQTLNNRLVTPHPQQHHMEGGTHTFQCPDACTQVDAAAPDAVVGARKAAGAANASASANAGAVSPPPTTGVAAKGRPAKANEEGPTAAAVDTGPLRDYVKNRQRSWVARQTTAARLKTSLYSFYLPAALGLAFCGKAQDAQLMQHVKKISLAIGEYFQAAEQATAAELYHLLQRYGNAEHVPWVKQFYIEKNIPSLYRNYEEQAVGHIRTYVVFHDGNQRHPFAEQERQQVQHQNQNVHHLHIFKKQQRSPQTRNLRSRSVHYTVLHLLRLCRHVAVAAV